MTPIAQRIADAQERYNEARDELTSHEEKIDDNNVTDEDLNLRKALQEKVEIKKKSLDSLKKTEEVLATTSEPMNPGTGLTVRSGRPFAFPAQKIAPQDYVWRSLAIQALMVATKRPGLEILKDRYGEDEPTKVIFDVVTKAAVVPADTTTSGWASQLVQTSFGEFFEALMPNSLYPGLRAKGGSFTFGRNGIISLPTRSATPTIAGSFVAQGAAIPVRKGAFTAITLTPKKMAVISTLTREIQEHSTPAIEGLIRQAILEDTAVAIDTVLVDANAATTTRPAGLVNGVSTQTPAGTTFSNMVTDLKNLYGVLITGTRGNIRSPVWLMGPDVKLAIALKENAGGDFPFKGDLDNGMLLGFPVLVSTTMTADTIILLDAADFATATGDVPQFNVSDQATIHEEDTTPLALSAVATPNTVAAPVRSLWQTDSIGIRMVMDINWTMRRTGTVALLTAPTWN